MAVGMTDYLVFISLAFQPLNTLPVSRDFSLVFLKLLLLLVIGDFVTLQLVSHQGAGAEAEGSADCCSGARMANSGANKPACRGAAQCSNPGSFFPCGQRATGTASD